MAESLLWLVIDSPLRVGQGLSVRLRNDLVKNLYI